MRVLSTDSLAMARLQGLTGRVIAVQVRGFETTLYMAIDGGTLLLATQTASSPDVTLSGHVSDFVSFAHARQTTQALPAGRLQIQGDLAVAQAIQQLLDDLDIDWEALLADQVGGVAAHQLGVGIRRGVAWWRETWGAMVEDVPAYLQHERRWVATADDVERFSRDGMTLGSDVERLAARIARLRDRGAR